MKSFVPTCVAALFALFCSTSFSYAQELKPIDRFIQQIKETHTFESAGTIWMQENNPELQKEILKKVSAARQLSINYDAVAALIKKNKLAINLTIPNVAGTGSYTLELGQYSYFTNEFKAVAHAPGIPDGVLDYTPGLYYSGVVKGIPGSIAAFSFFKNEVYGIFSIPGEGNYVLVPNTMVGEYYNSNPHYILFNDKDILDHTYAPKCATDELPASQNLFAAQKTTTFVNSKVFKTCNNVTIYELADYATFVSKGRSTTNVINFVTAHFNNMATIYRNENVLIALQYLKIDTVNDAYQTLPANSARWLNKFGYYTKDTLYGANLALMLTTKHGTMGGVAWLRQLCARYRSDSSGPYAFANIDNSAVVNFPTYSWNVEVTSHELGHSMGSPHTHRCCWNPSGTGTTAIDNCYTLEGTCANPGRPSGSVGGTVMSYCHLVSGVGINFSNGFGKQPGDTIRYWIRNNTCDTQYYPSTIVTTANRNLQANRECTNIFNGITYYYNDANTANQMDDTLILMVKKGTSNLENLDTAGFTVSGGTTPSYGSGTGATLTFPAGTPQTWAHTYGIRRFWKVTSSKTLSTPIEVIFPFTKTDSADLDGSCAGAPLPVRMCYMYKTTSLVDPNPAGGFSGATSTSFNMYSNGSSPTATQWSLERVGSNVLYAHFMVSTIAGGGSVYYSYAFPVGTSYLQGKNSDIIIYPNPASNTWNITFDSPIEQGTYINIYSTDGKLVNTLPLNETGTTSIDASKLPVGMYYYKIVNSQNVLSGTLIKE